MNQGLNDADRLDLPVTGPEELSEVWDEITGPLGPRHYDRAGNPISMRDWCRLKEFGGDDYIRVAQDTIGPYWISTVWLGLDHAFDGGRPLIFETMVFKQDGGKEDFHDLDIERYSTEEEALKGHRRMVDKVWLFVEAAS